MTSAFGVVNCFQNTMYAIRAEASASSNVNQWFCIQWNNVTYLKNGQSDYGLGSPNYSASSNFYSLGNSPTYSGYGEVNTLTASGVIGNVTSSTSSWNTSWGTSSGTSRNTSRTTTFGTNYSTSHITYG